ncbi:MAG: (deoxy)nucleoside triphosphate pyrophosphohydrolase, partial [Rhodospirillales bacterium]|nr:(deoxy)nucleoside triphosphate pyrophosphohydrolase [Rhodospirillales bacterium]
MKPINVVAAIIKKDDCYLIAKRNKNKYMGLKWEFPGGKVEDGETFEEALSREILEELNVNIKIYDKLAQEKYKDDEINVVLHYFQCSLISEDITLSEHETIAWVKKQDFCN